MTQPDAYRALVEPSPKPAMALDWATGDGAPMDQPMITGTFHTAEYRQEPGNWNGFPIIYLPKWQWFLLALLIPEAVGDGRQIVPSTRMEADGIPESDYVCADGLCWYAVDVDAMDAE